jgi:hypothetical protein
MIPMKTRWSILPPQPTRSRIPIQPQKPVLQRQPTPPLLALPLRLRTPFHPRKRRHRRPLHTYTFGDHNHHPYSDSLANLHCYTHGNRYSDAYRHLLSYSYLDAHGNRDTDAQLHTYIFGNRYHHSDSQPARPTLRYQAGRCWWPAGFKMGHGLD